MSRSGSETAAPHPVAEAGRRAAGTTGPVAFRATASGAGFKEAGVDGPISDIAFVLKGRRLLDGRICFCFLGAVGRLLSQLEHPRCPSRPGRRGRRATAGRSIQKSASWCWCWWRLFAAVNSVPGDGQSVRLSPPGAVFARCRVPRSFEALPVERVEVDAVGLVGDQQVAVDAIVRPPPPVSGR
jgi:hypothetical protein